MMVMLLGMMMAACVDNVYEEDDTCPVQQDKYLYDSSDAVPVDLGLSVQWAPFNVGAKAPEQLGNYYSWGDTDCRINGESYTEKYYTGVTTVPEGGICGTPYDVATVKWQECWRMPTVAEVTELVKNCQWTETQRNGVNGWEVTSYSNGNSIFLPKGGRCIEKRFEQIGVAGHYWQGSIQGNIGLSGLKVFDENPYLWGLNVRAVWDPSLQGTK